MHIRAVFAALALLLALVVPTLAREEIRAFTSDVTMRIDGSVRVIETVEVNAEGVDIRRGIYRDMPTVMLDGAERKIRSSLEVEGVTRDGVPEPFRVERMGNFQRIWIGDSEQLVSRGLHTYVLTYTMTRMGRSFPDHDELYWNATGNYWIFPIVNAVAKVTLPQGAVINNLVGYTGPVGSVEQAVIVNRSSDNSAIFTSRRELAAGEGMTVAVSFQAGFLVPPSGMDAFWIWLSDLRETIFPILGVILVLAYNLIAWNKVGRDPPKGTIIPLFHPPKGFSPALTHFVHRWGFQNSGWTAMTSAIFDLGVKGLVTIDNTDKTLTVTATGKEPKDPLPTGEQILFDYFRREKSVTVDKSTGPELEIKRGQFVAAITNENRATWFKRNTGYAVFGLFLAVMVLIALVVSEALEPGWLIAGIAGGIVLGIIATIVTSLWKGSRFSRFFVLLWVVIVGFNLFGGAMEALTHLTINSAAISAGSIVLITVIFARLMRAPTIQGRKVMDEIDGFKLYLDTAEKNRLNIVGEPPMSIERFERMLPYAIALGVEKPWTQHFEGELARNAVTAAGATGAAIGAGYSPLWYSGSTNFSANNISSTISAAAASMSAAMVAAQPVQASSSGFSSGGGGGGGGGFSGGGGGGGGGGGW